MKLRASAPGKLVLLGEYAVLEGAPALVMAVDRRAVVEIDDVAGAFCEVFAPDVHPEPVSFDVEADGSPRWQGPVGQIGQRLALVTQVLRGLASRELLPRTSYRLRLDSSAFFDRREGLPAKLGLGSSAAITTALASALAAFAGHDDRIRDRSGWLRTLLELHRGFQGGRGSGLDIAAALFGGVIHYRLGDAGRSPEVAPLTWPAQVHRLCVWSGRSASTARFLEALGQWREAHAQDYRVRMDALAEAARAGISAVATGDVDGLLRSVTATARNLRRLGDESKIPIFSDEHRLIAEVVERAGGHYKPCGAGGGDLGLAVARDAIARARIRAALDRAGHAVPELGVDDAGLQLD